MRKERKDFFFEKKKQKTFCRAVADSRDKSFLLLFFKKGVLAFEELNSNRGAVP
jgi:hypothetical protein